MDHTNFTTRFFLFVIVCILHQTNALGQDCPNMDIELTSQEEIDNFSTLYPNCTELKRDLCIGRCKATNLPYPVITSLAGLSQIEKIKGSLEIKYTSGLSDLNGLHNLVEIEHNLLIKTNEDLTSLEGLNSLKVIRCDLELLFLPITSLNGLSSLDTITGKLEITDNDNLLSLDGLSDTEFPGSEIRIGYNEALENIQGLSNLVSISEDIHISECPNLVDLQGLHNLTTVGNTIAIGGIDKLVDLSGLENLTNVGGRLNFSSNPNLQNLNGLDNLKSAFRVEIYSNESLSSLEGMMQMDSMRYLSLANNNGIEELQGLEQLEYIENIALSEANLKNLNGIGNTNILGRLYLNDNASLENLDGLQQFDSIGYIRIIGCNAMKDLSGLKESVLLDDFYLKENTSLENLEGLAEILSVDVFQIKDNPGIVSLTGLNVRSMNRLQLYNDSLLSSLEGLEMVDNLNVIAMEKLPSLTILQSPKNKSLENLSIVECNALTNLQGFYSIEMIEYFSIFSNDALVSLDGLESLRSTYGCSIFWNPVLEDIAGLQNIDPETIFEFAIHENPQLAMCNYSNICEIVSTLPIAWINYNAPGCNWPDDFICDGIIEGTVVYDYNCNGEIDSTDIPIEGLEIEFLNNNLTRYTSYTGKVYHFAQDGEELHIKFNNTPEWQIKSGESEYQFTYDQTQNNCCNYEFLLDYVDKSHDAEVDISLPNMRCNDEVKLRVHYMISGGLEAEGKVRLHIDELTQFISADPAPSMINGQWIEWDFPKTLPFEQKTITVTISTPNETFVDQEVEFTADIALDEQQSNIVDSELVSAIILCAFDPNDKQVYPYSEDGYTDFNDSVLLYTVRFQNVGNAEAIDITIRDTISEHLDIESFKLVSTSHREFLSISRFAPNVLAFDFKDIYLIDSLSDPELSQGYVQFSLELNKDLTPGTQIENKAHIYFDNNPPIVTNTTRNEFYFDVDGDGFLSILDCDDENENVNPNSEEVVYNGLDDDCNALTLDDDLDEDGFGIEEDCDDLNENIHPQIEEIVYNGIDDDCNELTLDDDLDEDGFGIEEDCDDLNENINPQIEEIVYNGIDDDCDELTLDDDLDQDGFGIEEDCDDENGEINPDVQEIPDNDVDENCDGILEYTTDIKEIGKSKISVYPNPAKTELNIISEGVELREVRIYNLEGGLVLLQEIDGVINVERLAPGVYILKCLGSDADFYNQKIVIMH